MRFVHWFLSRKRRPAPVFVSRLHVEALEERQVPTVTYNGGNLLPHVEAQALFLGNEWSHVSSYAAQTTTINSFLTDITGGAYMDALTRAGYGVGRGTASAGAVDQSLSAQNVTISDAAIQSVIQSDINRGLLQAPDANRLYIVYVQPNVAVDLGFGQGTTQQGILGYHGAFAGSTAGGAYQTIRYAIIAYPGGTSAGGVHNSSLGTSAIDQLTAVTSHELAEAVTDPDVNFGQLGWYDFRRGEIGDITESNPNALVRLDGYLVQEVADQNDQLLAITTAPPPTKTPPTQPTNPGALTTSTTLSASSVRYHWFGPATATLTVHVSSSSGQAVSGGTIELIYEGQILGTATVRIVNGVATATFGLQFFANGSYTFTAQYLGSGQFPASSSSAVTVNV
jgi:hypothetical protein